MANEFKIKRGLVIDQGGATITGSVLVSGSINATSFTGSFLGSASYALTASYAMNGGGGTPGGLDTYIQINTAGTFGGYDEFKYVYNSQSFAHGLAVTASGNYSHAEGGYTQAIGLYSHVEGYNTQTIGDFSHAEGNATITYGAASHAEGNSTTAGAKYYDNNGGQIEAGIITLSNTYGDVTADFNGGDLIVVVGLGYSQGPYYINSTSFVIASNTTLITLTDNTIFTQDQKYYIVNLNNLYPATSLPVVGIDSHAEGYTTRTLDIYSHAEGYETRAVGNASHAEGIGNYALGDYSHAEGASTSAIGEASHAEGNSNAAIARYSHAEGQANYVGGDYIVISSISNGVVNIDTYTDYTTLVNTVGKCRIDNFEYNSYSSSYSYPTTTIYLTDSAVNQGTYCYMPGIHFGAGFYGVAAHAEGSNNTVLGDYSHAEGNSNFTKGLYSHAEGSNTQAIGGSSHTEGESTKTYGAGSHAEGNSTFAGSDYSHAEGESAVAGILGYTSDSVATVSSGVITLAATEGNVTGSFTPGYFIIYSDVPFGGSFYCSRFEIASLNWNGTNTEINLVDTSLTWAGQAYVGVEGTAIPLYGYPSAKIGTTNHAEGANTFAYGYYNHVEGFGASTYGEYTHAEGQDTKAIGDLSHAEGDATITYGAASHAEGYQTRTVGNYSHAEGLGTVASGSGQHVSGYYNTHGDVTSLFIIGNGVDDANRSDVFRVTGSIVQITGSLEVTNGITGSFSGSFAGSIANATSASYALTASYVNGNITKANVVAPGAFSGTPLKATVTFATAFPNTNYSVAITGEDARIFTIENKLAGSFDINTNSNTTLTGDTHWHAISYGEFNG